MVGGGVGTKNPGQAHTKQEPPVLLQSIAVGLRTSHFLHG